MSKQLIITADDFGLSTGTNEAIIACHRAGSVTSTTLMVNMPAAKEAAALAKANPELGVGLHFTLTLGRPACSPEDVPTLVDENGCFRPRRATEQRAFSGRLRTADIRRELHGQLERFRSFGLEPTHVDSHQHIHLFPAVFNVLAEFCVEQSLPLRIPWVWQPSIKISLKRRLRMWVLKRLIQRNMQGWGAQLKVNHSLASVFDLGVAPEQIDIDSYRTILQACHESPLELMVHPARIDAEHSAMTRISAVSAAEYKVLSAGQLGPLTTELGYELTHFGKAFIGEVDRE